MMIYSVGYSVSKVFTDLELYAYHYMISKLMHGLYIKKPLKDLEPFSNFMRK